MYANWQMWSGELSKQTCEDLKQELLKIEPLQATTFNDSSDHRSSVVRWSHDLNIKKMLEPYFLRANSAAFGFDLGSVHDMEIQFTEYDAQYRGQYKVHHDIDWNNNTIQHRKLSMVIQLSDPADYEGGELQLTEVVNPVKNDLQKQGTVIVFPSYLQHAVTPVTEGKRYSLVLWLSGPRWR